MDAGKLAIGITAAAFTGFGAALMAKPERLLGMIGIRASEPVGRAELRAMYGGMEFGFGIFFALAARKPEWRQPALAAIALAIGALGATRVATAVTEGAGPMAYAMAAPEIAAATLAAIALAGKTGKQW